MKSYESLYKTIAFMYLNYSAMKKIFSTSESSRNLHSQTKSSFFFPFCPVFSPSQCFLLQLTLVTKSCTPTMRSEKTVKCPKNTVVTVVSMKIGPKTTKRKVQKLEINNSILFFPVNMLFKSTGFYYRKFTTCSDNLLAVSGLWYFSEHF